MAANNKPLKQFNPVKIKLEPYKGLEGRIEEIITPARKNGEDGVYMVSFVDKQKITRRMTMRWDEIEALGVYELPSYTLPAPLSVGDHRYTSYRTMLDRAREGLYRGQVFEPFPRPDDMSKEHLRKLRDLAREEQNALEKLFEDDMATAYGFIGNAWLEELFGRLFYRAWSDGHADGYENIVHCFDALFEIFDGMNVTLYSE